MKRQVRCRGIRMRLLGEMTIYTAAAVWKQLVEALNTHTQTRVLDLSQVTELDTAGLQIVLMARRVANAAGHELQIDQPSPAVTEVLDLLQLQSPVADSAKAHS